MRILIACEFSGIVREAFLRKGHNAISCDLLPSEIPGESKHIQCNVLSLLSSGWDMLIAHPPCTYLSSSGARWWRDKQEEQIDALRFVLKLWEAPISKICIENPIGRLSTFPPTGKPSQIIQPWQFGHGETKATCLWLKNLPLLLPTKVVEGREPRIHEMSPSVNRSKERSRTYTGIAEAMAEQWG